MPPTGGIQFSHCPSVSLSVLRNTIRVHSLIQVVLIRSPNLVRSCIRIMSRSRQTWVMLGPKLCHRVTQCVSNIQHGVRSLIQVVFIRSFPNSVRSCIYIMSTPSVNMGHAGQKTSSLGHLVRFKHSAWCPLSNSSSFHLIFTKLVHKFYLDGLQAKFEHACKEFAEKNIYKLQQMTYVTNKI